VILGTQIGLHPLSVCRAPAEDVFASLVSSYEAHGLDLGSVEDEVDGSVGAVDNINHAVGEAGLLGELD